MIIKAKFTDADGNPKGREYTYGCHDSVNVDDAVYSPEGKKLVATAVGLPDELGAEWGDKLKYLTSTPPEEKITQETISEPVQESAITELTISAESVIVVEQLPMIAERLREMSGQIDAQIEVVTSLACTLETKATIKKHRAALNSIFSDLEARRIAVKKQILAPYDAFDAIYKECVTEKIKAALATLDERTGAIDNELKNTLLTDAKEYFAEYAAVNKVDFLKWEDAKIQVSLTSNKTALRRAVKEFIDRVAADIAMIDTQEEAAEMHVEYRKHLNAPLAIKTVKDRAIAIYNEKQRLAKLAEAQAAEDERKKAMAAFFEGDSKRFREVALQPSAPMPEIQAPIPVVPEATPEAALAPEKQYTVAFKVTGSREVITALSQYLKDNGISYQQIPLKNIVEVSENE